MNKQRTSTLRTCRRTISEILAKLVAVHMTLCEIDPIRHDENLNRAKDALKVAQTQLEDADAWIKEALKEGEKNE